MEPQEKKDAGLSGLEKLSMGNDTNYDMHLGQQKQNVIDYDRKTFIDRIKEPFEAVYVATSMCLSNYFRILK